MKSLKHIGKIKSTAAKVVVVFRTLPGASDHALVLPAQTLPDAYHDALMQLVESDPAQEAFELGEMMFIRLFPDGRPMLQAMQVDGRLIKMATTDIIMTPNSQNEISLDRLNVLIAEQKNCAVDDLCNFVKGGTPDTNPNRPAPVVKEEVFVEDTATAPAGLDALSDTDLAKSYRSQADAMYKEAAKLRKQADELDPPKKKATATKVSETADA